MKKLLTDDEAINLLPAGDTIHTFRNMPFGLIGADWSKEDIIEELRKAEVIDHRRNSPEHEPRARDIQQKCKISIRHSFY